MTALDGLLVVLVAAWAVMVPLWLLSLKLEDASIVDLAWGPVFVWTAGVTSWWSGQSSLSAHLLLGMLVAWAARLGLHLARRNLGRGEDKRYAAMRAHHGTRFWWVSLFTVFLLQGALVAIISLPVQAVMVSGRDSLGPLEIAGLCVLTAGLMVEAIADHQLRRFSSDPGNKGKVLDRGLWRYSRHPNYFGDALWWWGAGLYGLAHGSGWVLMGPAVMTLLLLRVSGVRLLEKTIVDRRPAYAEYIARTSAFIPWFPKA